MSSVVSPHASEIDLLEVFCSSHSKLADQVTQLGGKSRRYGLDQGDLMTSEGRRDLFVILLKHRPRHVWLSPVCGPWSRSNLNSQKSLPAWDQIHHERWSMLAQVALCLVLCRHQHRCQKHAHWEQPKGSLMTKLPYFQELQRYMLTARPDMCTAGALKDPQSEGIGSSH